METQAASNMRQSFSVEGLSEEADNPLR
jgi:hypothetical protein